ncbi:hypothetical protein [Georgenia yuyongxinii]
MNDPVTPAGAGDLPGLDISALSGLQNVGRADVGYCADGVCFVPDAAGTGAVPVADPA